jgi:hypothetical protein
VKTGYIFPARCSRSLKGARLRFGHPAKDTDWQFDTRDQTNLLDHVQNIKVYEQA